MVGLFDEVNYIRKNRGLAPWLEWNQEQADHDMHISALRRKVSVCIKEIKDSVDRQIDNAKLAG